MVAFGQVFLPQKKESLDPWRTPSKLGYFHRGGVYTRNLNLWSALQPIVDVTTGQVVAHEALLHGPQGTRWESPGALFASADHLGLRTMLEANARRWALSRLGDLPESQRLFINIDVSL